MKINFKYILLVMLLILFGLSISMGREKKKILKKTAVTPYLDWKMHTVGNFRLQITNFGMIGGDNQYFVHPEGFISCEYPANSGIAHFEGGGLWLGAIIDTSSAPGIKKEIKKVTTGYEGWGGDGYSTGGGGLLNEMFPLNNKKDSILEITSKSLMPDYWSSYYGNRTFAPLSDQDFLCSYSDTILPSPDPMHVPIGIKILQRSLSWKSDYMDGIIIVEYEIINLRLKSIKDIYAGFFMDMDVGPYNIQKEKFGSNRNYWESNYAAFIDSIKLAYVDNPVDKPSTPIGHSIVKCSVPLENLKFSFHWYNSEQSPDPDSRRYDFLSNGYRMPDQSKTALNDTRFLVGFGPFNFMNSDTIKITTALVSGETTEDLIKKRDKAKNVISDNYFVPKAPNSPALNITSLNSGGLKLSWLTSGNENPENFVDYTNITAKYNFDGKVFEGFRIYKAESSNPTKKDFILIGQFDKKNNIWGYNNGLKYELIDTNVVPGRTYSYSVTSFTIEDTTKNHYRESLESSVFDNMKTVTAPYSTVVKNKISVVPNPYRTDGNYNSGINWENPNNWTENNRRLRFINLPEKCIIRIFTLNGEPIKTIEHLSAFDNWQNWDLRTESGRSVSSGIYIYTVESSTIKFTDKFVIIK